MAAAVVVTVVATLVATAMVVEAVVVVIVSALVVAVVSAVEVDLAADSTAIAASFFLSFSNLWRDHFLKNYYFCMLFMFLCYFFSIKLKEKIPLFQAQFCSLFEVLS